MTIIVFLIDTSASMNQKAYLGGRPSIIDVAKSAVETFVKVRQRNPESRQDRYMLLTFEESPSNIKAGWKENLSTFMTELKNLQCTGLTNMGTALKHSFDLLNLNRMQTGIDTYGQGRCPFYLEPSIILVITDGGKLSTANSVTDDFNLPMNLPIPGSELTREPFRWDQRLFALVLRLSGTPANEKDGLVPSDESPIDAMCEVTGGRSYCITSHRMMMQCIDSLVQKVQSGVVINFEKVGPDPELKADDPTYGQTQDCMLEDADNAKLNNSNNNQFSATNWHSCRKMIYVPRSAQKGFAVGFWPIPESFWPDVNMIMLPARSAHPNVKFMCVNQDPMVIDNLPFDKYELEPSPLTQYILARKQPTACWQVFVPNSTKTSEVGMPFGYLKASTYLTCVNLFVMPYNYPVLLPLLDELFKVHRQKPTQEWLAQFRAYIRTTPSYYAGPLRRALTRMGASNQLAQSLIPEACDTTLNFTVLNYLKRLKNQARTDFDRLCNDVISKQKAMGKASNSSTVHVVSKIALQKNMVTHPVLRDKQAAFRDQLSDYGGFVVGLPTSKANINGKSYTNAYDIHRSNLLDQIIRMRSNVLQPTVRIKLVDEDSTHSFPINQMGNYQEYLKRMTPPLRELEITPVRQHMFGNPFKIDKRMMVDEADIDLVNSSANSTTVSSGSKTPKRPLTPSSDAKSVKRKPGPIPRELTIKKPFGGFGSGVESITSSLTNLPERQSSILDDLPLPSVVSDGKTPNEHQILSELSSFCEELSKPKDQIDLKTRLIPDTISQINPGIHGSSSTALTIPFQSLDNLNSISIENENPEVSHVNINSNVNGKNEKSETNGVESASKKSEEKLTRGNGLKRNDHTDTNQNAKEIDVKSDLIIKTESKSDVAKIETKPETKRNSVTNAKAREIIKQPSLDYSNSAKRPFNLQNLNDQDAKLLDSLIRQIRRPGIEAKQRLLKELQEIPRGELKDCLLKRMMCECRRFKRVALQKELEEELNASDSSSVVEICFM